jgi:hypothetical protein
MSSKRKAGQDASKAAAKKAKRVEAKETTTVLKVPRGSKTFERLPHKDGKTWVGAVNGTGGTGYDDYMYEPGEAVYYRNNKVWQLGHIVKPQAMALNTARLWYWTVKLASDDPTANKWGHDVLQACALIPAKCAVFE